MTRSRTSLEAYRIIKENGMLSRARWEVYDALFHHGPLTRNELDEMLAPGRANPPYSRRLTELEDQGVAVRGRPRPCRLTGFNCEEWDVTDRLPTKLVRRGASMPSLSDRRMAAQELRKLYGMAKTNGVPFSDNLVRICRWLAR